MNFLKKRRNRVLLYIIAGFLLVFVLPSLAIKVYINSDSFRSRVIDTINRKAKLDNLKLIYKLGDIGIFSGIEFLSIRLMDKDNVVAGFENCFIKGIQNKVLFSKNSFDLKCSKGNVDIGYFEKMKGGEKKIGYQGSRSDYNIGFQIDSFEANYRKMKAEFELSGRYSLKEKYIDIELRDKYRIRVTDINIPEKSAKMSFTGIDIPFILERYLGRYAGLLGGKLSGSVLAKKKGQEIEIEFQDVAVTNMTLSHPLIGERPFGIKKFLLNGSFSLSIASGLVRLNELDANISDMNFVVSGKLYRNQYSVSIVTKKLELNDLAAFFGGEEFEGFDMSGEIRIKASASGNIEAEKKIDSISLTGEVVKPVQVSKRLDYLKSDFSYEFTNKNNKKRKILIGLKNPDYVPFSDIPPLVYGAVVVSEDAGFFGHKGVEFREIESAVIDNIESDKPYLRGGSTITQQLVKNLFLTREKTLLRKVKELLLAIELDAALSKERILEIYLNGIEWGPEIFGIGAASRHYFGKSPSELKVVEAAYLASVIPNPTRYYTYYVKNEISEKWNEKIQSILYRMNLFGYLPNEAYNKSLSDKIVFERSSDIK